jgi:hypothetical protein
VHPTVIRARRAVVAAVVLGLVALTLAVPASALAATPTQPGAPEQPAQPGAILLLPADLSLTIQLTAVYFSPSAPFHVGIAIANAGPMDADGFDTSITGAASFEHLRITNPGGFNCKLYRGIRNPTWGIGCTGDSLKAGAHTTIELDGVMPAQFGAYPIDGKVDTGGVIYEWNRANNSDSRDLNVI